MSLVASCDPFELFPYQVETVTLKQLPTAPGLQGKVIAENVHVIIKRHTAARTGAMVDTGYDDRTMDRRIHVKTSDIPEKYAANPDLMLDFAVVTKLGETYKIIGADRGDDMDLGRLPFLTWTVTPWGSVTL